MCLGAQPEPLPALCKYWTVEQGRWWIKEREGARDRDRERERERERELGLYLVPMEHSSYKYLDSTAYFK